MTQQSSILHVNPFPWNRPEAQRLNDVLCRNFSTPQRARLVANKSGVPDVTINYAQAPIDFWPDILNQTAESGAALRLVEVAVLHMDPSAPDRPFLLELLRSHGDRPADLTDAGALRMLTGRLGVGRGAPDHRSSVASAGDANTAWRVLSVAPPPPWYISRPMEEEQVIRSLLSQSSPSPTAIGTTLRGAGGFGKSMLARAVASTEQVRLRFPAGIGWLTLGQHPDVVPHIAGLIRSITGSSPVMASVDAAAGELSQLVGNREFLLVVDDVWRLSDLAAFGDGSSYWLGPKCRVLITTRVAGCQPPGCEAVFVDEMSDGQAAAILLRGLPEVPHDPDTTRAVYELAKLLGRWPLLLAIVRDELRKRLGDGTKLTIKSAIRQIREHLADNGVSAFDRADEIRREHAVSITLDLSLSRLRLEDFERLVDLSAFPEDAAIPFAVLDCLWGTGTKGIDRRNSARQILSTSTPQETLVRLYEQSLVQNVDFEKETVSLHDVIRDYLRTRKNGNSVFRAAEILESLREGSPADSARMGIRARAAFDLIPDGPWSALKGVRAKLRRVMTPERHRWHMRSTVMKYLRQHVFWHLNEALRQREAADLKEDAAWQRLLRMNTACVSIVALPDDRVLTGWKDGAVCVWNPFNGRRVLLVKHAESVRAMAVLSDGRFVSASADRTLRVWDPKTFRFRVLSGHTDVVSAVTVLEDGRLVSGSYDGTLRLWNLSSGACTVIADKRGYVRALAALSGAQFVASENASVQLWDADARTSREIGNHDDRVTSLAVLADDEVVSGAWDKNIWAWGFRSERGELLSGHTDHVTSIAAIRGGHRFASGSADTTIRLWEPRARKSMELVGHTSGVTCIALLSDGSIVSGSSDQTVRLWEASLGYRRS